MESKKRLEPDVAIWSKKEAVSIKLDEIETLMKGGKPIPLPLRSESERIKTEHELYRNRTVQLDR